MLSCSENFHQIAQRISCTYSEKLKSVEYLTTTFLQIDDDLLLFYYIIHSMPILLDALLPYEPCVCPSVGRCVGWLVG